MRLHRNFLAHIICTLAILSMTIQPVFACTGITLKAKDGAVVFGRTMEWGSFDLNSRLIIVPRGHKFTSLLDDHKPGVTWIGKHGVVGVDAVGKDVVVDGMNEKGLQVGLFYHPGTSQYQEFELAKIGESMAPTDVGTYLLTTCASVEEAREALKKVRVVPVVEPALGIVADVHFIITEPSGKSIVVEYLKGELTIFDAPLGVITNSPSYDWHETNLRNHVNLSAVAIPDKKIADLNFKPLGGGSGMIGLPGDNTPPSRFVRAVAFTQTARPTADGQETIYELFRILDNFNCPLGSAEGTGGEANTQGMRSSTLWTTAYDTKNKVLYYHTQHNRRVRKVDLNKVDFAPGKLVQMPLEKEKSQDIEDVTPRK